MERTGTPDDPADWSDPDTWIPEWLSGEDRKLAYAIWEGSNKNVNPRHTAGSWELLRKCQLLAEDPDGKLQLTDRGRDFVDQAFGSAEALVDEQEGLIGLLSIVGDTGPARSGVLVEPWAKFLLERNSPFRSSTTIKDTLRRRLSNLLDRDLLKKEGLDYSITETGLDYLKRVGGPPEAQMRRATLDTYLAAAQEKRDEIYSAELYKEEDLAKALKNARAAVLDDDDDWPQLVTQAIKHRDNNIIFYVNKTKLANWIADDPAKAREALSALWSKDDRPAGDRVRSFDAIVPATVWPRSAVGTRLTTASYLMMAVDPQRYPPYQRTPFTKTYRRLQYPMPSAKDAGGVYDHALGFLDRLIEEARQRGMDRPSTRLDAQSVVWHLREEPMDNDGGPSPADGFTKLARSLEDDGLLFSQELVANYILALQTKRFAILTGISGTGKTRIATAVAEHFRPTVARRVPTKIPADAVELEVRLSHHKHSLLTVPQLMATRLSLLGTDAPRADRRIRIRYPGGETALTYYHKGSTELYLSGEFKKWYHSNLELGDQIWLRVREGETPDSDEFEIGLPETEIKEQPLHNHVVVPVRPDWVDNRGLLGYLNPLTNEYSTTPFLSLLLRARKEEERAATAGEKPHPFFVILDEMNLARVEHYFSDFLSALESGEPIPLHEDERIESGEAESGPQVPRQLMVPSNVLFTGTVNVDETTYMFSPKVLDRAFTIEFDQVDLKGFTEGTSSEDTSGLNLDGVQGSLDLLPSGRSDDDDWKPSREDWVTFSEASDKHHKALLQLHAILEAQHRHFGYRVANEIARFVNLAREQAPEADSDAAANAAFDLALMQKVLPKFHGTQQELESLLEEIFRFAVHGGDHVPKKYRTAEVNDWRVVKGRLVIRSKPQAPSQSPSGDAGAEGGEADSANAEAADADNATAAEPDNPEATDTATQSPAYPRTGAKVLRMLHRLRDRGFTSFIE
ncbi:MAG: hypothetical protein OXF01_18390 [Gemmatimonadetes bacterium]|nr:hypothetical protein [Gemmatimonadota bacterium]